MLDQPAFHLSQDHIRTSHLISILLAPISLVISLAILMAYRSLRNSCPDLVNHVSLRLIIAATVANALYSFFQILGTLLVWTGGSRACSFAVWGMVAFALLPILLHTTVALNVHLLYLQGPRDPKGLETRYYLGATFLALLLSLPGGIAGRYGLAKDRGSCWYLDVGSTSTFIWLWSTYYIYPLLAALYGLYIGWRMWGRLGHYRDLISPSSRPTPSQQQSSTDQVIEVELAEMREREKTRLHLDRTMIRILLYSPIPLVCQGLLLVLDQLAYAERSRHIPWFGLLIGATLGTSLQGAIHGFLFLLDPGVRIAWQEMMLQWSGLESPKEEGDSWAKQAKAFVGRLLTERPKPEAPTNIWSQMSPPSLISSPTLSRNPILHGPWPISQSTDESDHTDEIVDNMVILTSTTSSPASYRYISLSDPVPDRGTQSAPGMLYPSTWFTTAPYELFGDSGVEEQDESHFILPLKSSPLLPSSLSPSHDDPLLDTPINYF
ncbi:MAG: hypothetical protein DHS80DRAFT_20870 [Piptocephalis tieghemiana]|nr:MAG: hypothetical protein DHS80DRAFT_20870 [Piptocephalis tieghemiana]